MRKINYSEADLINWWMVPYHGITIEAAFEKEPWTDSRDFYSRYQVTQEQHDEWYEKVVTTFMKRYRWSRRHTIGQLCFIYLNTSPMVIR